jgi:hypothetical protein
MSDRDTIGGYEIFVVQIAKLGGTKLGLPDQPEGAWTDNEVFLDRSEAEAEARLYETLPLHDEAGKDLSADVLTIARVVTIQELQEEFGDDRMYTVMTMFSGRITELLEARRTSS